MDKKYELTNETKEFYGMVLHRIRALKDFGRVRAGDLGGWVEKEDNLSQLGACWVYENAMVYGNAWVYGNARVCENAEVTGNAKVHGNAKVCWNAKVYEDAEVYGSAWVAENALVYEDAMVYGSAWVYEDAMVYGSAKVYEDAMVYGSAKVYGNAWVCENAEVTGNAKVSENARVYGNAAITGCMHIQKTRDYLTVGPVGSRNDFTTFAKDQNGNVAASCGCFYGTLDKFSEKVGETHGNSKFGVEYRAAIELAKAHFTEEEEQ